MLLSTLLQELPECQCTGNTSVHVVGVTDRVAEVVQGMLFVAIEGTNFDGHTVISEAISKGAAAIVTKTNAEPLPSFVSHIRVPSTRLALARLSLRMVPGAAEAVTALTWIGVTGTNGKTTVATLIEQLLHESGRVTAFVGTTLIGYRDGAGAMHAMDTSYTTPHARQLYELAILFHANGVTHVVMEVSSHGLHQHRVAGISFAGAVFTNLTRDHLDYHGSMHEYAQAKQTLFSNLSKGAVAVVNAHDEYALLMLEECTAHRQLLVSVSNVTLTSEGADFTVHVKETSTSICNDSHFTTTLLGWFNASNAALACTTAVALGANAEAVTSLARTLKPPKGRMERFTLKNGAIAVVDYAHTPDALEQALRTLRSLTSHLCVVFGCGGDRDSGKRMIMGQVASAIANEIVLTSDNPRNEDPLKIITDIQAGIPRETYVTIQPDRALAIKKALLEASADSIVLIAGKGHETYQEVRGVRTHFSDQEEVLRFT